jgi:hypothetical protein
MAEKKVKVLIGNKTISLSPAAYKIAKRFYGAVSEEELQLAKPIELQKPLIRPTMKPVIIKPPLKEVPEVKVPEGDPMVIEAPKFIDDVTGDPVKSVTKAKAKRKKK